MAVKRAVKRKRGKKNGRKPLFLVDPGKLFFLAGTVVVLCILLLFINVLFGDAAAAPSGLGGSFPAEAGGTQARSGNPDADPKAGSLSAAVPQPAGGGGPAAASGASSPPAAPGAVSAAAGSGARDASAPRAAQSHDPAPAFDLPPAQGRARLCFVIDDAGQNLGTLQRYLDLSLPLAVAVLPQLPLTQEAASRVVAAGKELMLHQPMQAENLSLWAGPGAVMPGMGLAEIKALVTGNLRELGRGVRGLNNHEGSLITEDEVRIGAVLDAAQDYGVFFMDSRTTALTKAPEAARIRGLRILERDIFIDNVLEREAMLAQIYEGIALANRKGKAIMIGHVDKSAEILPALLEDLTPALRKQGYEIVCPSQLLAD